MAVLHCKEETNCMLLVRLAGGWVSVTGLQLCILSVWVAKCCYNLVGKCIFQWLNCWVLGGASEAQAFFCHCSGKWSLSENALFSASSNKSNSGPPFPPLLWPLWRCMSGPPGWTHVHLFKQEDSPQQMYFPPYVRTDLRTAETGVLSDRHEGLTPTICPVSGVIVQLPVFSTQFCVAPVAIWTSLRSLLQHHYDMDSLWL